VLAGVFWYWFSSLDSSCVEVGGHGEGDRHGGTSFEFNDLGEWIGKQKT
jgi:hypothetical protein